MYIFSYQYIFYPASWDKIENVLIRKSASNWEFYVERKKVLFPEEYTIYKCQIENISLI